MQKALKEHSLMEGRTEAEVAFSLNGADELASLPYFCGPSICQRALGMLPHLGCCTQCCGVHEGDTVFKLVFPLSSHKHLEVEMLGCMVVS